MACLSASFSRQFIMSHLTQRIIFYTHKFLQYRSNYSALGVDALIDLWSY